MKIVGYLARGVFIYFHPEVMQVACAEETGGYRLEILLSRMRKSITHVHYYDYYYGRGNQGVG